MTRRKNLDFAFDFNEDADPVEELHRLRLAATKRFKTMREHQEYLRATPTAREMLAELDAEIAQRNAKVKKSPAPARRGQAERRSRRRPVTTE